MLYEFQNLIMNFGILMNEAIPHMGWRESLLWDAVSESEHVSSYVTSADASEDDPSALSASERV